MPEASDSVATLERALAQTGRLLEGTSGDRLGHPTPCSGWDVHALINHIAGAPAYFAALVSGEPFGPVVEVPDGSGAYERLAGFLGRRPLHAAW